MRPIDADEYVKEIKRREYIAEVGMTDAIDPNLDHEIFTEREYWNGVLGTFAEAMDVAESMPTVGGWVSVEDRLPEPVCARNMKDIKPVLLYSPKGGYYVGWYYGPDWNGKKLFINRTSRNSWQYITTKVTHWMPLPPGPPEENVDG